MAVSHYESNTQAGDVCHRTWDAVGGVWICGVFVWEDSGWRDVAASPLTQWCASWTAAWSRSSPSRCRWSRWAARWASCRPRGLLSAAAGPHGSRPPSRSRLLLTPVWCSAGPAPVTTHGNTQALLLQLWTTWKPTPQVYTNCDEEHINWKVTPLFVKCTLNL